jgi:septum formation protein
MSKRLTSIALASLSPRRKLLLETAGFAVEVISSTYDETPPQSGDSTGDLVLTHAKGKADCAQPLGPPTLVAADTLVEIDGKILGKPRDSLEASAMLRELSGKVHQVFTGFVVRDRNSEQERSGVESTRVRFRVLSDLEIEQYVATREPLDKAGAYGILGRGSFLIESIAGDFYTVVGLPLARIGTALRELGYSLFAS